MRRRVQFSAKYRSAAVGAVTEAQERREFEYCLLTSSTQHSGSSGYYALLSCERERSGDGVMVVERMLS